jgi:hypothetical protein
VGATLGAVHFPSPSDELKDPSPNLHSDGVTPDEVLAFQEAQDTYRAANPETTPQPESLRTLAAQLDLVRAGSKPNMFFEGVTRDQLPATMRPIAGRTSTIDGVDTPGGNEVFNKAAIRPLCGPAGSGLLHQRAGRRPPPLLQTVNDNRSADGTRRPILPKEFKPLVDTPDGPKPMSSK